MNYYEYAQLLSVVALSVSIGILMNLSHAKKMAAEMVSSSVGYLLGGIVPTVYGAWIMIQHNNWSDFWSILVSLLGWLIFFLGLFRLWFVHAWERLLKRNIKYLPALFGLFGLIGGLLLFYIGFISHYLR